MVWCRTRVRTDLTSIRERRAAFDQETHSVKASDSMRNISLATLFSRILKIRFVSVQYSTHFPNTRHVFECTIRTSARSKTCRMCLHCAVNSRHLKKALLKNAHAMCDRARRLIYFIRDNVRTLARHVRSGGPKFKFIQLPSAHFSVFVA